MGLDLKTLQMCFLFWGWTTLLQGEKIPGLCMRTASCKIFEVVKQSLSESNIPEQLTEALLKNLGGSATIKGLKVKDFRPSTITVRNIADERMSSLVIIWITVAGQSFIGGMMENTVVSEVATDINMVIENKNLVFKVDRCKVKVKSCKTNLPSSMLPKTVNKCLDSTLVKVLPGVLCPVAEKVIDAMQRATDEMWAERQFGSLGTVQYSINSNPNITSNHAAVCFEAEIKKANGEEIESPTGLVPLAHSDMPELGDRNSDIIFPVWFMDAFTGLYKDALNQDVYNDTMKIPESFGNQTSKIRSASPPTWTLNKGAATLNVPLTLEFVSLPQQETLSIIDVDLKIPATFWLGQGVLQISLGNSSVEDVELKYSEVGTFDPERLNDYLLDLLKVTSVPALQEAMKDGMPLPSMMGSSYAEPTIEILPNAVRAIVHCESE